MTGLCSFAVQSRSVRGRLATALILFRLAAPTVIALTVLVLGNITSSEALARGRGHHHSRSSATAAAARKKKMIQTIQSQVAVARQVLAAAESQAAMSQSQLSAAMSRIEEARQAIGAADSADDSFTSTLRAIEERLLAAVEPDSELDRAEATVEKAQEALDRELHRVLTIPEHGGKVTAQDRESDRQSLSRNDRDALRNDSQYQQRLRELGAAKQKYARLREDFLKQHSEWVAAAKARRDADRDEAKAKQQLSTAAKQSMPARRQLRSGQEVAAAARATIAQGEAMLRQLGVRPTQANASKPKK